MKRNYKIGRFKDWKIGRFIISESPNLRIFQSSSGFTIIETLIAITVLMIAIAGPLVVASDGLFGALASRDQMIASYLAQESMEVIKNTRDNNVAAIENGNNTISWDTTPDGGTHFGGCTGPTANGTAYYCDASAADSPYQIVTCGGGASPCQIYFESGGYYGHYDNVGATVTPFTRYFYITISPSDYGDEYIVTVVVNWLEGTTPYSVTLTSELAIAGR